MVTTSLQDTELSIVPISPPMTMSKPISHRLAAAANGKQKAFLDVLNAVRPYVLTRRSPQFVKSLAQLDLVEDIDLK